MNITGSQSTTPGNNPQGVRVEELRFSAAGWRLWSAGVRRLGGSSRVIAVFGHQRKNVCSLGGRRRSTAKSNFGKAEPESKAQLLLGNQATTNLEEKEKGEGGK